METENKFGLFYKLIYICFVITGKDSGLPVRKGRSGSKKFNSLTKHNLMETNELTPEKSLEIISDAITKGRREFEKNSGTPMIFWGCIILVFSIVIWMILKQTENPLWNFLWFGVPAIGWPLSLICIKDTGIKGAKNFINETVKQVWTGYGIFATAIAAIQGCMAPLSISHLSSSQCWVTGHS